MRSLLVLRHAKSSWKNVNLSDFDRPLNKRGKKDAPRMGELLRREGLVPDLIISSSAKRAVATTEAVATACGYESEIKYTRQLYHAWSDEYIEVLNEVADEYNRVMVVGHNPGMESLVEDLTGEWIRMPTATFVLISVKNSQWSRLKADTTNTLVNVWRPKELPTDR